MLNRDGSEKSAIKIDGSQVPLLFRIDTFGTAIENLGESGSSIAHDERAFEEEHTHGVVKTPGLIWGYNQTCSFGLMTFDTTADDPTVTFECVTIDGEVTHSFELKASALRAAKQ